jgi:manganese/iron transport system substrate-binding protein
MSSLFRPAWLLLLLSMVGCVASGPTSTQAPAPTPVPAGRPLVVVTHSVLCSLTQQIAAETVDLKCLISPGTDPHVYQPTPDDRKAIENAQLVLYGGYQFEPELIRIIQATTSPAPKVAVDELAVPQPQQFEEDGQRESDPHVWHNAQNGVAMVQVICDRLSQLETRNTDLYRTTANKLTDELRQIDRWIKTSLATIPPTARKLVTTHDALGYYSQAYDLPVEGALQGLSTTEAPTAKRVKELVQEIQATQVPTVFAETSINPKLIDSVAKAAKVKLAEQELYTDGIGAAGTPGDTYQKMLIANTETIVQGLGGQVKPLN